MYFIMGVVKLQSLQLYSKAVMLPALAWRMYTRCSLAATASATQRQRENKLTKDILNTRTLQD